MHTSHSQLPFLAVLIPVLSAPLAAILRDKRSNTFTVASNLLTFVVISFMYPAVTSGEVLVAMVDTGLKIKLGFMADALSLLAGGIAVVVWTLASLYSVEYMAHSHAQRRYNLFSLLSLAGMLGVVFAKNLFTLYIFFEILSVCSYVMVVHEESPEAQQAGTKYLFMGVAGGLILLASIITTYTITGTIDLVELSRQSAVLGQHRWMPLIFMGYVIGFGVKAGIFPVHVWLPDAHPIAPSPASALLSGVMIKAGAYGIARTIFSIVGVDSLQHQVALMLVLGFALINIFLGSAMAIRQQELKRMLAYSSISQIGYVILGLVLLSPRGVIGGVVHIFNHAIIKGTLFLCAGAFIHQTGLRYLKDLRGIGRRMPLTTACFTLGALSMIGFPPFNGFISKWFLALGAIQVGKTGSYSMGVGLAALGVLLLSSLMNLIYYGPIVYRAWFPVDEEGNAAGNSGEETCDPKPYMSVPLVLLAAGIVFFGIFPQLPVHLAKQFSYFIFR